jgi:hypothetical protein
MSTYRERERARIHPSHVLGMARSEILAPAGEPRYYEVQKCTLCGGSVSEAAAGLFIDDELFRRCWSAPAEPVDDHADFERTG